MKKHPKVKKAKGLDPNPQQKFNYKQYQKLARIIHRKFCADAEWCNYGKPIPPEIADDDSLPQPEQQARVVKRLEWYRHCQAAVDAENIAASIVIRKSGKVKVRDRYQ